MIPRDLVDELRGYLFALDQLSRKILAARRTARRAPKVMREVVLQGLASYLCDYYSSCERIFERISVGVNGGLPEGDEWHKTLLGRMTLDVRGVRPPVLQESTRRGLDELRKFRHAMRHLYGVEIDPERLKKHLAPFASLNRAVVGDLNRFLSAMEEIVS